MRDESIRSAAEQDELIESHLWVAHTITARIIKHRHSLRGLAADDILSVAVLALIRAAEIWEAARGVKFGSYAFSACWHNVWRTVYQQQPFRPYEPEAFERLPDHRTIESDDPEHDSVARSLRRLDRQDREILLLCFWGGLSQREIADHFDLSQNRVSQRIKRGLKRLRQEIKIDPRVCVS
jgi:RNA polymerase sigma factor (sigma-70 family)